MNHPRHAAAAALIALALGLNACIEERAGSSAPSAQAPAQGATARTPDPANLGLKITDEKVGTGPEAMAGSMVSVQYTGWLASNHQKFDSSYDRNRPFEFRLGAGNVIKGWDLGVAGMKVGGKRNLVIPAALGYGAAGAGGGLIPANADLVFDVELLEVK
jgi:FKBP-type peptidyl-prolyl cis-trans isomerase